MIFSNHAGRQQGVPTQENPSKKYPNNATAKIGLRYWALCQSWSLVLLVFDRAAAAVLGITFFIISHFPLSHFIKLFHQVISSVILSLSYLSSLCHHCHLTVINLSSLSLLCHHCHQYVITLLSLCHNCFITLCQLSSSSHQSFHLIKSVHQVSSSSHFIKSLSSLSSFYHHSVITLSSLTL